MEIESKSNHNHQLEQTVKSVSAEVIKVSDYVKHFLQYQFKKCGGGVHF